MASRTQQRTNAPAPPRAHGPPSALRIPQAHSARTSLAPNPRRGNTARFGAVAVLIARDGAPRFGGRVRLPEPAEGPGDLDAAADAPEPDESEDGCREEDIEHGEEVGVAGGRRKEKLKDVKGNTADVDKLGKWLVRQADGMMRSWCCLLGRGTVAMTVGERGRGCSRQGGSKVLPWRCTTQSNRRVGAEATYYACC